MWLVGVKAMGLSALLVILCLVSAVAVFLLMWSIYSIASLCQWHPEERDWDLKNGSVHEEDGGSVAARDEKLGRDKS